MFKIKSNCSSRLEPCYSERTHHITLNAYNDLPKECIVGFIENIDILTDHRSSSTIIQKQQNHIK